MPLIFSEACYPTPFGIIMELKERTGCCEIEFEFSEDWQIGDLEYLPNECGNSPEASGRESSNTFLGSPIDYEVYSGGILVDDDIGFAVGRTATRSDIFEAGQHLVNLTADPGQGFAGGLSACNGQHSIPRGRFIATVPAKTAFSIVLFDNHGIETFVRGSLIVRPVSPP
jgi:hypothetical protein